MRRFLFAVAVGALAAAAPSAASAGNREVSQKIAKDLHKSGRLTDYNIGVTYDEGTVYLRGRVNSPEQMQAAIELTEGMSGVNQVVSQLEIKAGGKPSAGKTAKAPAKSAGAIKQSSFPDPAVPAEEPAAEAGQPVEEMPVAEMSAAPRQAPVASANNPIRRTAQRPPRAMTRMAQHVDEGAPLESAPEAIGVRGTPRPMVAPGMGGGVAPMRYDEPHMPNHAWPSYAAYPNYAAVTYPRQYSASAWPYIGPFYPYPQVPLGWRRVSLEWDDGWWFLDFDDRACHKKHCW